jgi:hypothetical protein
VPAVFAAGALLLPAGAVAEFPVEAAQAARAAASTTSSTPAAMRRAVISRRVITHPLSVTDLTVTVAVGGTDGVVER